MSSPVGLPGEQYLELMGRVRERFEVIRRLKAIGPQNFSACEGIAFHLRKIIEGIAFGCLVACENGLKQIPSDAKGQWNADTIFAQLDKRKLIVFPNPSQLRNATDAEARESGVKVVIEGLPECVLQYPQVREIYRSTYPFLHEKNPYRPSQFGPAIFKKLWYDVDLIWKLIERHFIVIGGEGFYCTLVDSQDGQTKVIPLSRETTH